MQTQAPDKQHATADNETLFARLERTAAELRGDIVTYSSQTKTPHLASCLSCVDVLTCLYFDLLRIDPADPRAADRDRFILSKGHAAPALFQVLARSGFFPSELLWNSNHEAGGLFGEHPPTPSHLAGIEAATGSLGHGFPMGVGMAIAGQLGKQDFHVYALLGDGECNEGSVWEAAMLAGGRDLSNLTVIVDFNKWQATGRSQEVMALDPLVDKWRAFGWEACEVDGHDVRAVHAALSSRYERPHAIVAHTVKGKGVSFMEDDNNWHYRTPTQDEVQTAKQELGLLS
ncbi:MAG: transketolase [Pseudomonadota bacterium]